MSKQLKELRERILNLVRAGNHPLIAAQSVGVPRSTFWRWQAQARTGKRLYAQFMEELAQAEGEAEARDVLMTQRASTVDKVETACPSCGDKIQIDPLTMLNLGAHVERQQRLKSMAANHAMQRLSVRFPERWSPRVTHTIEQEHNRLLDVAQRVLEPEVFESLLTAYLASTSGEPETGGGPAKQEPRSVH